MVGSGSGAVVAVVTAAVGAVAAVAVVTAAVGALLS